MERERGNREKIAGLKNKFLSTLTRKLTAIACSHYPFGVFQDCVKKYLLKSTRKYQEIKFGFVESPP
ncbi:hypothetical protein L596_029119 [Steinernema carpocapsae]|uniref:Uncharacterized protein n=1 Tax=Steinernema carpocapsae TaxID=34508 RepID=A0A4U5LTP8_STECR|nr:hypothetical protein L596_029119 [Steinernema carpocapsae]